MLFSLKSIEENCYDYVMAQERSGEDPGWVTVEV